MTIPGIVCESCLVGDIPCVLMYPQSVSYSSNTLWNSATWNDRILNYRSSLWTLDNKPMSLGWKKFFNWNENTGNRKPTNISECHITEKIDGSSLMISKFAGNLICRTRRTLDVSKKLGGEDAVKFANILYSNGFIEEGKTYIFEWYDPRRRIIVDHGNVTRFYLSGIVNNADYSYCNHIVLDTLVCRINDRLRAFPYPFVHRPATAIFTSIKDMLLQVPDINDLEGVCIFYNGEQDILKLKTNWWLKRHAELCGCTKNLERIRVKYPDMFSSWFENKFDHECVTYYKQENKC